MKRIRPSIIVLSIALFALLFVASGCSTTRIDKIAAALTPPKDPGIVDMDISGRGIVVKYHRDTSVGGAARSNAGPAVVITPETTLKIQTVK